MERADDVAFMSEWLSVDDEVALKQVLLHNERLISLNLEHGTPAAGWIGKAMHELDLPEGSLVALIRRNGQVIVPRGKTTLQADDQITIIGQAQDISQLYGIHGVEDHHATDELESAIVESESAPVKEI